MWTATFTHLFSLPLAPPVFTHDKLEEDVTLKVKATHEMDLKFSGWPKPKVTWTLNGKKITEKRIQEDTSYGSTCLKLKDAKRPDSGDYKVTVVNDLGSIEKAIHVTVIGKSWNH